MRFLILGGDAAVNKAWAQAIPDRWRPRSADRRILDSRRRRRPPRPLEGGRRVVRERATFQKEGGVGRLRNERGHD